MKLVLRAAAIIPLVFFMINCGDSASTGATNKYIGEAPGIAPAVMKGYFRGLEKLEDLEKFIFHPRSEYVKYI